MKRTNFVIATFVWLASSILGCLPVEAQSSMPGVIFSDYGPNMSITSNGWCVSGPTSPDCGPLVPRWVASPFTPASDATLTQIKLALGFGSGTNGAVIELVSDASGRPGSTALESWTPTGLSSGTSPELSLDSVKHPVLKAGTRYWLVAMGSASDTFDFWWDGTSGTGAVESNNDGASWYPLPGLLPAFEVLGGCTTTPPPVPPDASLKTWSQQDPAWADFSYDDVVGGAIIGGPHGQGCALICLNYALNYAGENLDPIFLDELLSGGAYSPPVALPDGSLKPGSGGQVIFSAGTLLASNGTLKFDKAFSPLTQTAALDSFLCSSDPHPVIVQVTNSKGGTHYVVVTGKSGNDYTILDPCCRNSPPTMLSQYKQNNPTNRSR